MGRYATYKEPRRITWRPLAVAAGVLSLAILIVYLIVQSASGGSGGAAADKTAEQHQSDSIRGTFAEAQGRGHFSYRCSPSRMSVPFCPGVDRSGDASAR